MRLAMVGFRHGHVGAIWSSAQRLDYVEVVACVEEDPAARQGIARDLGITLTHDTFDEALAAAEFEAVACVEYYAKRGPVVIKALQAGKHVITDKPLCTEIEQLREIARLARQRDLIVHVDLTMRYDATACTFARLVREGAVGQVASVIVFGQHPLSWGTRPGWYFEEGKHGGTINDIMVHGFDAVRWATGQEFTQVIAATASAVPGSPAPVFFQQSAQCLLALEGGGRMFGDASYLVPAGHHAPWRFFVWGTEGYISYELGGVIELQRPGEPPERVPSDPGPGLDPFEDFARQVEFGAPPHLSREDCLQATLVALTAQKAADTGERDVEVGRIGDQA